MELISINIGHEHVLSHAKASGKTSIYKLFFACGVTGCSRSCHVWPIAYSPHGKRRGRHIHVQLSNHDLDG